MSLEDARDHNRKNNFSKLPRELRNMIYIWLLIFTPIISTQWMYAPITLHLADTAQNDTRPLEGLPLWLLTCEVFLLEGRAILQQSFDFIIGPYRLSMNNWRNPKLQVLTPSAKETLTIRTDVIEVIDYVRGACFKLGTVALNTIKHILRYVSEEEENNAMGGSHQMLRVLHVQAAFINVCSICQWHTRHSTAVTKWHLDLSCLEKLGLDLDVFEFEVRDVDTKLAQDGHIHSANCWPQVEQVFEMEVRRVGDVLTGDSNGAFSRNAIVFAQLKAVVFRFERRTSRSSDSTVRFADEGYVEAPTFQKGCPQRR